MKAQRENRDISLALTLALDEGGWSKPPLGRITLWEREPVHIVQEAGWAPSPALLLLLLLFIVLVVVVVVVLLAYLDY